VSEMCRGVLEQYGNTAWYRAVYANRWTRFNVGEQLLKMMKKKKENKLLNTVYFLAFLVLLNSCLQET
jgi:hypothetical protein